MRSEYKVVENSSKKVLFYGNNLALALQIVKTSEEVYKSETTLLIGEKNAVQNPRA